MIFKSTSKISPFSIQEHYIIVSYLALAETEDIPLITADEGLYNAVKKDLKWAMWLGEV